MPRRWRALIVVAVVAAACTNGANSPDAKVVDPAAQRYAGTVTVVETRDHGPELCVDAVSAVPIEGETSKQGTTWGTYRVAGVYDGGTFTLTERPGPPGPSTLFPNEPLTTPCSPPEDGWRPVDAGRAND